MKILICVNTLTSVDAQVYSNHFAWAYHLGRLQEQKGWEFIFYTPWRTSIDRARNEAARYALNMDCDYLMFVDDDMLLDIRTFETLLDADRDIVMAHTYIRGYPFKPMSFKNVGDERNIDLKHFDDLFDKVDEKGVADCAAIGFACVLIKTRLVRELEPPYFVTTPNSTEDIYFCLRCKQELKDVTVAVDTRVPTAHAMDKEFVSEKNVKAMRLYFEAMGFGEKKEDERWDRGTEYHKTIEEAGE